MTNTEFAKQNALSVMMVAIDVNITKERIDVRYVMAVKDVFIKN